MRNPAAPRNSTAQKLKSTQHLRPWHWIARRHFVGPELILARNCRQILQFSTFAVVSTLPRKSQEVLGAQISADSCSWGQLFCSFRCFLRANFREGDEDSNFSIFRVRRFSESPEPLHWTAFPVEILTKPPIHWIAFPLFTENPFFSLKSASSHPLPKNRLRFPASATIRVKWGTSWWFPVHTYKRNVAIQGANFLLEGGFS